MKRTRLLLILCAALVVCACGKNEPKTYEGTLDVEVTHYDYRFDLSTATSTSTLTLEVTTEGNCLTLPFRLDEITEARFDSRAAQSVDLDTTAGTMTACDKRGFPEGATGSFTVTAPVVERTWGATQVGYSIRNDLSGTPFHYLLSWVGQCDRHGPCDARPDRFATYDFTLTHPSEYQILCSGDIEEISDTETACHFALDGGPTYSTFAFMAAQNWEMTSLGSASGVDISVYDFPQGTLAAALDPAALHGYLDWLESQLGPYPYGPSLRLAAVPSYWLGFEHPGNIALFQQVAQISTAYADPPHHTTLHEITHQWAGDQTTLAGVYDFVWKEAAAEYLTFVYESEQIDPATGLATARAWKLYSDGAQWYPVPGEQPELLNYYGDVYGPGPMILFRQLEGWYGRTAILNALASVFGSPGTLSVAELQSALETATGADLQGYFDAWVYRSGIPAWPEATVTVTDLTGGSYDVGVDVTTADAVPRGTKFTVQLIGGAGETFDVELDFGVNGDLSPLPQTVVPGFVVTDSVLDPYAEALIYDAGGTGRTAHINPWVAR